MKKKKRKMEKKRKIKNKIILLLIILFFPTLPACQMVRDVLNSNETEKKTKPAQTPIENYIKNYKAPYAIFFSQGIRNGTFFILANKQEWAYLGKRDGFHVVELITPFKKMKIAHVFLCNENGKVINAYVGELDGRGRKVAIGKMKYSKCKKKYSYVDRRKEKETLKIKGKKLECFKIKGKVIDTKTGKIIFEGINWYTKTLKRISNVSFRKDWGIKVQSKKKRESLIKKNILNFGYNAKLRLKLP